MNMALNQEVRDKMQQMDANNRKIESKDSMWKPAPLVGRETNYQTQPMTAAQNQSLPTMTTINQTYEQYQQQPQ